MSRNERERLTIMVGVQEQKLTLVPAAELLGVSYRQSSWGIGANHSRGAACPAGRGGRLGP